MLNDIQTSLSMILDEEDKSLKQKLKMALVAEIEECFCCKMDDRETYFVSDSVPIIIFKEMPFAVIEILFNNFSFLITHLNISIVNSDPGLNDKMFYNKARDKEYIFELAKDEEKAWLYKNFDLFAENFETSFHF